MNPADTSPYRNTSATNENILWMLDRSFIFLPLKVGKRALFHCDVHKWYSFKIYWTGTVIMWMAWRSIALMYSQQTKTRFKKASIQLNVWNAFCIFPEESENEHVLNPECLGIWFSHQLYPCFSPDRLVLVHGLMERLPHVLTGWMDTYSLSLKSWFFLHWKVFNNFIFTRHVHSSSLQIVLWRNVLGHVFLLLFPLFLWCRTFCLPLSFKTSGSHVGLT